MGYQEELEALLENQKKKRNKLAHSGEKKLARFSFSLKKLVLLLLFLAVGVWAFFYFFSAESEEELIRKQFEAVAELLRKEKAEGVIVAAANMQKLGRYFAPVTRIEIEGLNWMSGDLDREAIIRHAFRGRSMFERLSIDFALHEFGIQGENATVLFTVSLSGQWRNGGTMREARELEAVLNKSSGKWLFTSCRINELIKK